MTTHDHHGTDHDAGRSAPHDQAFWDERYRTRPSLWSGQPNLRLTEETVDLAPGAALDVGCGEGADSIWLASRAWYVTGIDLSTVALGRAAANAALAGVEIAERITWQHADLTSWVPGAGVYDLVSAQYMHLPAALRDPVFRRLATAVAPGGTLLVVGHHPGSSGRWPRTRSTRATTSSRCSTPTRGRS